MTDVTREFSAASKRAQAIEAYFANALTAEKIAGLVRRHIIEGGYTMTVFRPRIPDLKSDYFGTSPLDAPCLERLESELKTRFPVINHLRFASGFTDPPIVIDTKPNTWWRRTFSGPRPVPE